MLCGACQTSYSTSHLCPKRRQCDGCPQLINPDRQTETSEHPGYVFHSKSCMAEWQGMAAPQPLTPGSKPL